MNPRLNHNFERSIQAPFQLKIIPECGHWIQQEVPKLVNSELLNFFQRHSIAAPESRA